MKDFDYDCAQKKRIARGAFNRKGTTDRKGCRLPYENLTKKEREALNGEVRTVGFNDKITWDFFKALPVDLQAEYLNYQIDRFGIGLSTLSRDLFGLEPSSLRKYVDKHDLKVNVPRRGGKRSQATMEKWRHWINGEPEIAPVTEAAEIAPQEEEVKPFRAHDFEDMFRECGMEREEKPEEPDAEPEEIGCLYPLTDLSMTLKGTPIDILATLRMSFPTLLDKDKTYRFTIKVDDYVI